MCCATTMNSNIPLLVTLQIPMETLSLLPKFTACKLNIHFISPDIDLRHLNPGSENVIASNE